MPGQSEDLYEGDPSPAPESKPDTSEKEEDSSKTFLVPSEICPDMKPGEEMVVTIKAVHDDQYEISYAPKKKGGEDAVSKPMAAAAEEGEAGGRETNSMYS